MGGDVDAATDPLVYVAVVLGAAALVTSVIGLRRGAKSQR
jgi:hypothetical protein